MRYLPLLITLFSHNTNANELQFGAITYHYNTSAYSNFSNKIGFNLITNPMLGYSWCDKDSQSYACATAIGGINSVGKPLAGGLLRGGYTFKHGAVGPAFGAYADGTNEFKARRINRKATISADGVGITPIVGIETRFKHLSLLITPAILAAYLTFDVGQ